MKLTIFDNQKQKTGDRELPVQFSEAYRPGIIKRAVLSLQSAQRQPYGAKIGAGMRHSAELSRRRRKYRGSYGIGISRVQRKIMSRRGRRLNWVGAVVPGTVGGRRAHPPKVEKDWLQKINKKERRLAIRSAMAATLSYDIVRERGHLAPKDYPFIVSSTIESLEKAKDVLGTLKTLGLDEELERVCGRKVRAGKGKSRGRKYKRKIGPLVVVGDSCKLLTAGKNLPGVRVVRVQEVNAELLAPGAVPGRVVLWTEHACDVIEKKGLFK